MKSTLITILEQNLPNVPYLILTEDAVQCMLEPADFYPARPLFAVANVVRKHSSQFNGPVYSHIFGDQLLISMNQEEFRLQNQIMLLRSN